MTSREGEGHSVGADRRPGWCRRRLYVFPVTASVQATSQDARARRDLLQPGGSSRGPQGHMRGRLRDGRKAKREADREDLVLTTGCVVTWEKEATALGWGERWPEPVP